MASSKSGQELASAHHDEGVSVLLKRTAQNGFKPLSSDLFTIEYSSRYSDYQCFRRIDGRILGGSGEHIIKKGQSVFEEFYLSEGTSKIDIDCKSFSKLHPVHLVLNFNPVLKGSQDDIAKI